MKLTIILFLTFARISLLGEVIPAQEVQNIRIIIRKIESDLDSRQYDEDLKMGLLAVVKKYGVEGIAVIALEEPVLMQALMISPSLGYKKMIKVLLKQATDEAELEQMLVKITLARLVVEHVVGQDLEGPHVIHFIKYDLSPSLSIGYGELQKIISAVNAVAQNHKVKDGTAVSDALRTRLVELSGESFFFIGSREFIIGQVEYFPKGR